MSTIDSPAIGMATINAVSVDCPAKNESDPCMGPVACRMGRPS